MLVDLVILFIHSWLLRGRARLFPRAGAARAHGPAAVRRGMGPRHAAGRRPQCSNVLHTVAYSRITTTTQEDAHVTSRMLPLSLGVYRAATPPAVRPPRHQVHRCGVAYSPAAPMLHRCIRVTALTSRHPSAAAPHRTAVPWMTEPSAASPHRRCCYRCCRCRCRRRPTSTQSECSQKHGNGVWEQPSSRPSHSVGDAGPRPMSERSAPGQ